MDARVLRINEAAQYIKNILGDFIPMAGIVLGSGLGKLADKIENPVEVKKKK